MAEETATSRFEAAIGDFLAQLNKLEESLRSTEGQVQTLGANASAQLNQTAAAAGNAASGMQRLHSSAGPLQGMTGIFSSIAGTVRLLVGALGAAAPYITGLPDAINSK